MKDQLFTMAPELPGLPPELLERMQEETKRTFWADGTKRCTH